MSTIVVDTFLTLDGVMQAPGRPEEDSSGGFPHGGWQVPFFDEAVGEFVGAGTASTDGLLLGRRTYEILGGFWSRVGPDHPHAAIAEILNRVPKYVASRTLTSLDWNNSTPLGPDVPAAVARLRDQDRGEIHVIGSADLLRTLIRHDLVDQYRLTIFPVVLGTGKKLFAEGTVPTGLRLVDSKTTPSGVICAVYERSGEVTYGAHPDADL